MMLISKELVSFKSDFVYVLLSVRNFLKLYTKRFVEETRKLVHQMFAHVEQKR